jgi:hypothetical protein
MQGSAFKNLRMFRSLCGGDALKNVILATSFWDQVEPRYGEKREQELITSKQFWAEMVAKGSKVMRLERNRATCLAVLREIAKNQRMDLQAQKEMVEQNKSILDTAAGRAAMQDSETAKVQKQMREAREKEKKRMRRLANKQARKAKREKVTLQVDAGWRNVQSTSPTHATSANCGRCRYTMQSRSGNLSSRKKGKRGNYPATHTATTTRIAGSESSHKPGGISASKYKVIWEYKHTAIKAY